jgi:hypothetical protein
MNATSLENDHDFPCASLSRAEQLFVEMLRQIQEERTGDVSFFNSKVGDAGVGFSVSAFGGGELLGNIVGTRAIQYDHGLDEKERDRLIRRGWTLPDEKGTKASVPTRNWEGITSRADRHHIAQEMLSVATDIYKIPEERKIRFQLRHDGTPGPSSSTRAE